MAVMITDLFAGFRKKACKNIHFHLSFFKNVEGCMDVGMAVSKTTELGVWTMVCREDMYYKGCTSNPIPTSFLLHHSAFSQ